MLKIKDILDKEIIYEANLGDEYYWSYKFIVKIDEDNYCLINYDGSYSGYIPFNMESVDECFASAFMEGIRFYKSGSTLRQYVSEYYEKYVEDEEAILIPKEKIQSYLDILEIKGE